MTDSVKTDQFFADLEGYRSQFPQQIKPCILICGGTGSGKTTTINTLFGSAVGLVGHYSRGTANDELYEWEARGTDIDIVDLPGLGDSQERDKEYREMYRRRVEQAHGFIVVTTPPRPASLPTLRTVKVLLSCGVPARNIVIAYNRLALLNVQDADGDLRPVQIDGLAGPIHPDELTLVEDARQQLLTDLRAGAQADFTEKQIVTYDALTGWNLYGVLTAVLDTLPGDTLVPWQNAVQDAADRAAARQVKRSARDAERIADLERQIAAMQAAVAQNNAAAAAERDALERRLADQQERHKANTESTVTIQRKKDEYDGRAMNRFADFLERKSLPNVAKAVRTVADSGRRLWKWLSS